MAGLALSLRNARAEQNRAALNAGPAGALFKVYDNTGARPATGAAITTQILLATLVAAEDCGSVSNGVLTVPAMTDTAADAGGVPGFVRATDSTGAFVGDFSVGTSNAEFILSVSPITAGLPVNGTLTLTEGNP